MTERTAMPDRLSHSEATDPRLVSAETLIRHAERRADEMRAWMVGGMSDRIRKREFERFTRDRDEYREWLNDAE